MEARTQRRLQARQDEREATQKRIEEDARRVRSYQKIGMPDGTQIDPPPKNVIFATARFAKYAATQVGLGRSFHDPRSISPH